MAIQHAEWLNENAGRNYPIQEDCSRQAAVATGALLPGVYLPNYLLVDAIFTVPGTLGTRIYLAQVAYANNALSLLFRATDGSTFTTLAVLSVTGAGSSSAYPVTGIGTWQDSRGWVVLGDISRLAQDLPEGVYYFSATTALLEARCCRPAVRGVRSLKISNKGTESAELRGDVSLFAGANISLSYDALNNGIWISAVPNAGYQEACACDAVSSKTSLVNTINGIALKDVVIVGDGECVDVTTSGNTITISDKCSTPCCGCPELDFLNQTIDTINSSLTRLEQYSQQLNASITAFTTNYILTVGA